jgi:hypothetical protein
VVPTGCNCSGNKVNSRGISAKLVYEVVNYSGVVEEFDDMISARAKIAITPGTWLRTSSRNV